MIAVRRHPRHRLSASNPSKGQVPGFHGAGERTTRHSGYGVSQRIEEGVGWGKEIGPLRRIRVRGRERVDMVFALRAAACNLIRLPKLLGDAIAA